MKINALIADPSDNVVTVTSDVRKGGEVSYYCADKVVTVPAVTDVPEYHKLAVRKIEKGEAVIKYGETIGYATAAIRPGEHAHTQNISSDGR